jgi:hypothetical protein
MDNTLTDTKMNSMNITRRDYFAGLAMQALISKIPLLDSEGEFGKKVERSDNLKLNEDVAESAYYYADAMLNCGQETN